MNTDGTNLIELTQGGTLSWSPDGTMLVYSFGLGRWLGDVVDIYIMDANGANRVNFTKGRRKINISPVMSPDENKIAFASYRDHNYEIYVMDADGKNPKNLTLHLDSDTCPTWSPDGRKIAYAAARDANRADPWNANLDIFVMNADGTHPVRLTEDARLNWFPSWSPDSKRIVFERAHEDDPMYCDIFMMNANGTGLVNLTQALVVPEWDPSWRPTPFSVSSRGKLSVIWGTVKQKH